jgi:Rad3-related DNA helicase
MKELNFKECFPFDEARMYQEQIVAAVDKSFVANEKKYVIACLPTAIGKSAISVALANHYGDTYFLTSQKSLQKQYIKDFASFGMKMVQGRYNYTCSLNTELKCDMGVCHSNPAEFNRTVPKSQRTPNGKMCTDCPYLVARNEALTAPLSNMNYTYFFNMVLADELQSDNPDYVPKIQKRDMIVLDETHQLASELISFMTTKIAVNDLKEFELTNLVRIPKEKLSDDDKFTWLFDTCLKAFQSRWRNELASLESMTPNDPNMYFQTRKTKYLDTIVCMINRLRAALDETETPGVVVQMNPFEISFKPLFAGKIAHNYLYKFADKVLLMSATVFNKKQFCKNVGIDTLEATYITCTSPIPKERRPIKVIPSINLGYKHKEANKPKLLAMVKDILSHHKGERGIIHTVNYDIASFLVENLADDRLILPRGKERDAKIEQFINSDREDLVLISPSLTEGISLDDDLSRFSVICKLPYKNLGDPWIKARMEVDENWYNTETLHTLVQMTGRVVRSPEDTGVNYILDANFPMFFRKNIQVFPKWWKESIKIIRDGVWK